MSQYRHNHYVPIWYQKRFMLDGEHRHYRLDLKRSDHCSSQCESTPTVEKSEGRN